MLGVGEYKASSLPAILLHKDSKEKQVRGIKSKKKMVKFCTYPNEIGTNHIWIKTSYCKKLSDDKVYGSKNHIWNIRID